MRITKRMLVDLGACASQVKLFERLCPRGTQVTLKACRIAADAGLYLSWFASRVFTKKALDVYIRELWRDLDMDSETECRRARARAFYHAAKRMENNNGNHR